MHVFTAVAMTGNPGRASICVVADGVAYAELVQGEITNAHAALLAVALGVERLDGRRGIVWTNSTDAARVHAIKFHAAFPRAYDDVVKMIQWRTYAEVRHLYDEVESKWMLLAKQCARTVLESK